MFQQKCMSFSKCSNYKLKTLHASNFVIKEIKGRAVISNKQNVENEVFKLGFKLRKIKLIEKFKLKIKVIETKVEQSTQNKIYRIFSDSKCRLNFENPPTGSG